MVMFFNVKPVREFLLKNGFVYSLRKKRKRVGNDTAVVGSYYKKKSIVKIYIEEICNIKEAKQLIPYTFESGLAPEGFTEEFPPDMALWKVEERVANKWFYLAQKLSGKELWLYKVSVRKDG